MITVESTGTVDEAHRLTGVGAGLRAAGPAFGPHRDPRGEEAAAFGKWLAGESE